MPSNTSRPNQGSENPTTEKLARLLISADGGCAMLYCSVHEIGCSRTADWFEAIADYFGDISREMRALAAATEGRSNG